MERFTKELVRRIENRIKYNEKYLKTFPKARMSFTYKLQISTYKNVIDIINQLAKDYNNGWISYKEKKPEKDGQYIVAVKNLTGHWIMKKNVFVCDYQYGEFVFQGWEDNEVIYWQPLPDAPED